MVCLRELSTKITVVHLSSHHQAWRQVITAQNIKYTTLVLHNRILYMNPERSSYQRWILLSNSVHHKYSCCVWYLVLLKYKLTLSQLQQWCSQCQHLIVVRYITAVNATGLTAMPNRTASSFLEDVNNPTWWTWPCLLVPLYNYAFIATNYRAE